MNSAITLRPVTPDDEPFLLAVYASTRARELTLTNWSDEQKSQFVRMQFQAQKQHYVQHYPGASFEVILLSGAAVGRLYLHRSEKEIRIMDISLLSEFRGRGIGTWLLRRIQESAASEQRSVGIHVEAFNPALKLYETLGFKQSGDRGAYTFMAWRAEKEPVTKSAG